MEARDDDDRVVAHAIQKLVGKSTEQIPPRVSM
jgi:hypothetical protein